MAGKRAAIYARFSSHNQRSESIEIQLEKAHEYCGGNGLKVVREYCDYAQTGRDTDRREFQQMLADARRGLFDFVVISKVTRIMRNRDEMALARIMLRRAGVDILYADEQLADGSAGVLQLGMLEVLAEYESALDSERIRDGIQKNARRCMASGQRIFGWDVEGGVFVVNPAEADVVRRAYRMLFDGATMADIARALAPYRTKRGGKWTVKAVGRMLRRRQNGGEYSFAGVTVPGGMPEIVPMEWVERAERILRDTTRPRRRLGNEDFRLTGKLYHEDGSAMVGTSGTGHRGRTYHYYRCRECGRTVRRDAIEPRVADAVRAALGREDVRDRIAALMVEYEREREGESPQSARLEAELRGIHAAYANIWKAIEEGMAPPGGRERIDALRARQELLEEELEEARRIERVRLDPDRVRFWLESVAGSLDDEAALCSFVSRVVLRDGDGDPLDVVFTFDESAGDQGEGVRVDSPELQPVSRHSASSGLRLR
ncbi:recombinase family protein [Collinsella tanakaei]|nr:recombinase family protein [Collinsella tanakaei]